MAARTTITALRETIQTALADELLQAFIDDADLWITEELVSAGLSDARLELVERYLAASLVRVREVALVSASLQDVRETYQMDPRVSEYLQRAASMDSSGRVRRMFVTQATPATFRVGRRFSHPRGRGWR